MSVKFYMIFSILLSMSYANGHECETNADDHEAALKCHLLSNFDLLSPPRLAQTSRNMVGHLVMAYIDLNIEDGILLLIGKISMQWQDERVKWDSEKFGGLHALKNIKADSVWKPNLTLNNDLFGDSMYKSSFGSGHLIMEEDGFMHLKSPVDLHTRCDASSNSWPWDPRKCVLNFTINTPALYFTVSDIMLDDVPEVVSLWTVIDLTEENRFPYLTIEVTLKMKNCSLQVVSYLALTAVSLVLLPSFLISPVSRIKLASKISSLLLLIIFLVMMMNLIPNFFIIAPNFLIGYVMMLSIVGISICITAYLLRLARKSHSYHPSLNMEVETSKENECKNEAMEITPFEGIVSARSTTELVLRKSQKEWIKIAEIIEYSLFVISALLVVFLTLSFMN